MIAEGRVAVNGTLVAQLGARVAPASDRVEIDGVVVRPAPRRWVVLHKPVGVLCTRRDPHGGRTVYDVLPPWGAGLRYVGRLDRDTSGLLLLTNDGDLAAALAHPRGRVEREYLARLAGQITRGCDRPPQVRRRAGGRIRTSPARSEGGAGSRRVGCGARPRGGKEARGAEDVREAVGHSVAALVRTRFGPFRLGGMKPGGVRPAREDELTEARALVGAAEGRRQAARRGAHR